MEVMVFDREALDNATGEKCVVCGIDFGWIYAFGCKPLKGGFCSLECKYPKSELHGNLAGRNGGNGIKMY